MKYIEGDIREATETFIAHGCNSQGVMGSGVALAIKNKWPKAFEQYRSDLLDNKAAFGDCSFCDISTDDGEKYIMNLITQDQYGTEKRQVNYAAIVSSLTHAISIANLDYEIGVDQIAIPKIGAGLGGGDWDIIETILKDFEEFYGIEFTVYFIG